MKKLALFLVVCLLVQAIGFVAVAEGTSQDKEIPAVVSAGGGVFCRNDLPAKPVEEPAAPVEEAAAPVEESAAPEEEAAAPAAEPAVENADLKGAAPSDYVVVDGVIVQYNGTQTAITLPLVDKDGNPVTRLSEACFARNTAIQSVTMPNAIDVDAGAFRNCISLLSVSMHNAITDIAAECFAGCTALQSVSWPENLYSIGQGAFSGCTSLTGVPTGTNLTWIGDNAFANCTALTYADLPDTVLDIGQGAFSGCTNLKEIVIPDSVVWVGNRAYENCTSAEKLKLSKNMKVINNYTFSGDSALTTIAIPDGVEEIGREAFYGCSGATIIRLPASVKQVGNNAFYGTPSNKWVRWDDCAATYIGTDGLGVSGYVLAPIGSQAQKYADAHSGVYFASTLVRDFVERNYNLILGRVSDEPGLLNWCAQVATGARNGATLVKSFVNSQEFIQKKLSVPAIVEIFYNVFLDRASDPYGKADWVNRMTNGVTIDYLINGFAGSQEFINLCKSYLMEPGKVELTNYRDKNYNVTRFVARAYLQTLSRTFDEAGLEGWVKAILTKTRTPAEVMHGFVFSKECTDRKLTDEQFVHMLYQAYFGRNEDPAGMANWLAKLADGKTREYVNSGFAGSQEFIDLLKTFGLDNK